MLLIFICETFFSDNSPLRWWIFFENVPTYIYSTHDTNEHGWKRKKLLKSYIRYECNTKQNIKYCLNILRNIRPFWMQFIFGELNFEGFNFVLKIYSNPFENCLNCMNNSLEFIFTILMSYYEMCIFET